MLFQRTPFQIDVNIEAKPGETRLSVDGAVDGHVAAGFDCAGNTSDAFESSRTDDSDVTNNFVNFRSD